MDMWETFILTLNPDTNNLFHLILLVYVKFCMKSRIANLIELEHERKNCMESLIPNHDLLGGSKGHSITMTCTEKSISRNFIVDIY